LKLYSILKKTICKGIGVEVFNNIGKSCGLQVAGLQGYRVTGLQVASCKLRVAGWKGD